MFKIMEFGILRTISWFIKFTTHPSVPLPAFVSRAATDQRNPEEPQEGRPRVPRCILPGIKCSGTCNGGAHAPLQTRVRQAGRRTQTLGQSRSQESWGRCQAPGGPHLPGTVRQVLAAFQGCVGKEAVQVEVPGVLQTTPAGRPVSPSCSESSGWPRSVVPDQRCGRRRGPLLRAELLLPERWRPPNP